jgi:hypothetical protein
MRSAFDWIITEKNRGQCIDKVETHVHTATADNNTAVVV